MFEPLFTRLAGQFHLVAPDYPGFGHSDAPTPKEFSYTFDNIAKVMDHFTEALNLTRYTLYMQDYGGPVGFRMALAHPDRVEALIVQDAVAHNEGLGANWKTRRAFWADRAANEAALRDELALSGRPRGRARRQRPEPREVRSRSLDRRIRIPEQARRGRHPERSVLRPAVSAALKPRATRNSHRHELGHAHRDLRRRRDRRRDRLLPQPARRAPIVIERHAVAGAASGKSGGFLALDWCRGSALDRTGAAEL